jgi:phage terminase large subunit-like protein
MNLAHVHRLLKATIERNGGCLRIVDGQDDRQARLMAMAGLVEITRGNRGGAITSIDAVTDLGQSFLRTFENAPVLAPLPPPPIHSAAELSERRAALIEKWKVNFALHLRRPPKPCG